MRKCAGFLGRLLPVFFLFFVLVQSCLGTERDALRVFFIDVEGGQATLFVTPDGHSLLIDTGSPGFADRDPSRIAAAARLAGLTKIDDVLITHYHADHAGGVLGLSRLIPIGTFIDHGPNRETSDEGTTEVWKEYQSVLKTGSYSHITAHAGDILSIPGITVTVVTADGSVISQPVNEGGIANKYCATSGTPPEDHTENARSLGVLIRFGNIRILDLGDLTRDQEIQLMCPVNRIGSIDVLVVSHHGLILSSSPALVDAVHPRVAIMDNGATKGNAPEVFKTIEGSPGLEDLWQLHYSENNGDPLNTSPAYIANLKGPDQGLYLELIGRGTGDFTIFNSRTLAAKNYPSRDAHSNESAQTPGNR